MIPNAGLEDHRERAEVGPVPQGQTAEVIVKRALNEAGCPVEDLYVDSDETRLSLVDGTRIKLRLLQRTDKPKLAEMFRRLSPATRYRRWFTVKKTLTARELRFLAEFDGDSHWALAAVSADSTGREREILGVARFIRPTPDATAAELAIVVDDAWQRRGLGRLLLRRLLSAARLRGIERLQCYLLADNHGAQRLLERVCRNVAFHREATLVAAEIPIAAPDRDPVSAYMRYTEACIVNLLQLAEGSLAIAWCAVMTAQALGWQAGRSLMAPHSWLRAD